MEAWGLGGSHQGAGGKTGVGAAEVNDAVAKVSVKNVVLAASHCHVSLKRCGRDGF